MNELATFLTLDHKKYPKGIGLAPNILDYAAVLYFSHRELNEKYKLGDTMDKEDWKEPFFCLGFTTYEDWKNFVSIINHQDDLYEKWRETHKEKVNY